MRRITCAARRRRKSSRRCSAGAITRRRFRNSTKGKFYGFATMLPCGGPAFIKETERAIRQLGLKGVLIHSSHKGHYPDDDEARPFWELIAGSRRAGLHSSAPCRLRRRADEGISARVQHRPAGRSLPGAVAADRARRFGGFSARHHRRFPWRRRHLRSHRPDELRLRIAGRVLLSSAPTRRSRSSTSPAIISSACISTP